MSNTLLKQFFSLVLWFTCAVAALAKAQSLKVNASLDTAIIKIGAQTIWKIQAQTHRKAKVVFPVFKDTITSAVEWVQTLKPDTTKTAHQDSISVTQRYVITAFDSGYFPLPPVKVFLQNDTSVSAYTSALLLTVRTVQVDTTAAIKAIKGPQEVPWNYREWLVYLYIQAGLAVLAVLVWYLLKKRKPAPVQSIPVEEMVPPHIRALKDLETLQEQKLWQQGNVKLYHIRISDILRTYIEGRYNVLALEMTTHEISRNLRGMVFPEELNLKLIRILALSDLVKFAKENPLPNENEFSIQIAFEFVKNTMDVSSANPVNEA